MKNKYEVLHHLCTFVLYVHTQFSAKIQQFQGDGGGKYGNGQFKTFCLSLGIHHHTSCPHTPAQNGLAKQKHRPIADIACTFLYVSHVLVHHWPKAIFTAIYLIHHLPSHKLQRSSQFSHLFGSITSYFKLRVFNCACYPHLGAYLTSKLLPRIIECVFLGYNM